LRLGAGSTEWGKWVRVGGGFGAIKEGGVSVCHFTCPFWRKGWGRIPPKIKLGWKKKGDERGKIDRRGWFFFGNPEAVKKSLVGNVAHTGGLVLRKRGRGATGISLGTGIRKEGVKGAGSSAYRRRPSSLRNWPSPWLPSRKKVCFSRETLGPLGPSWRNILRGGGCGSQRGGQKKCIILLRDLPGYGSEGS